MSVQCTCSSQSNTNPRHCPGHSLFQLLLSKKTSLHEPFQAVKFHHDSPNGHVPGTNFLEFLVHALSIIAESESEKYGCKSHTVSAENSPYLLLSNAKMLVKKLCSLHVVFAHFKTKSYSKLFHFLVTTTVKRFM